MLEVKKSCLHVWFTPWVIIYHYNMINMVRMLILRSMYKFDIKLLYGGQKVGIVTVF